MLILELLKCVVCSAPDAAARIGAALLKSGDEQIRWALDAGLGSMLHRVISPESAGLPAALRNQLVGADLTAQVMHGCRIDTVNDVIDACRHAGTGVTLLKGMSISEQYYSPAHLRPMTDIDVLVQPDHRSAVESELLKCGYEYGAYTPGEESHDGVPLHHAGRRTFIEVHHALFAEGAPLRRKGLFNAANIKDESVDWRFHGRPVKRLSDELQLVYIASYWIRDLAVHGIHPSLVVPLFDAALILRNSERSLEWDRIFSWLDNETAMASLYLMLAWLYEHGLATTSPRVLARLADSQSMIGPIELRVIHWMIDKYLVAGRPLLICNSRHVMTNLLASGSHTSRILLLPWRVAFPPTYPHRFDARLQLQRAGRLLRRLAGSVPGRQ